MASVVIASTMISVVIASTSALAAGCTSCLADNGQANIDTFRVWCYTNSQCQTISDFAASSCSDFAVDPSHCACRPDVYTTCESCAPHLDCVWVANATVTYNVTYKLPFLAKKAFGHTTKWTHGRCVPAGTLLPGSNDYQASFGDLSSFSMNVTKSTKPDTFFWAECGLAAPPFVGALLGASLLLLCCALCLCCECRRRARKRRTALLAAQREVLVAGYEPYAVQAR